MSFLKDRYGIRSKILVIMSQIYLPIQDSNLQSFNYKCNVLPTELSGFPRSPLTRTANTDRWSSGTLGYRLSSKHVTFVRIVRIVFAAVSTSSKVMYMNCGHIYYHRWLLKSGIIWSTRVECYFWHKISVPQLSTLIDFTSVPWLDLLASCWASRGIWNISHL